VKQADSLMYRTESDVPENIIMQLRVVYAGKGRPEPVDGAASVGQWIKYLLQSQCLSAYYMMFRTSMG
jgi:hypothetical protein